MRRQKWQKRSRMLTALLLAMTVFAGLFTGISIGGAQAQAETMPQNPVIDASGEVTWDCIYFGSYWQEDTNLDGVADKKDEKTPIKWRVLSVSGNDAFLIADKNLDMQKYNENGYFGSWIWKTSIMRSWLNGYSGSNTNQKDYSADGENFISNAFSAQEQAAIKLTALKNNDNPNPNAYTTVTDEQNPDTEDKIFLLSLTDIANTSYGFSNYDLANKANGGAVKTLAHEQSSGTFYDYVYDDAKLRYNTEFAKGKDVAMGYDEENHANACNTYYSGTYTGTGTYWLRSVGEYMSSPAKVYADGWVDPSAGKVTIDDKVRSGQGVCPALHLDLSSTEWRYAGTTSTESRKTRPQNPRLLENGVVYDCIYFGRYYQEDTDCNGEMNYYYDKMMPIKWRVLSVDGNDAFLVADKILDVWRYHNVYNEDVTWETSTLRTWLNGDFKNRAFSTDEQAAIIETTLENADNPKIPAYGKGGNSTKDRVFLLSLDDMLQSKYGFKNADYTKDVDLVSQDRWFVYHDDQYVGGGLDLPFYISDAAKLRMCTTYAAMKRTEDFRPTPDKPSAINTYQWWLRSPGGSAQSAGAVKTNCAVNANGYAVAADTYVEGFMMSYNNPGVCPALHLDLSKNVWFYGDTLTLDDSKYGDNAPIPGSGNPTHVHSPKFLPITAVTCTTAGVKTPYYICEECGEAFEDASCSEVVKILNLDAYKIPALGHDFGANNEVCSRCKIKNPNYKAPAGSGSGSDKKEEYVENKKAVEADDGSKATTTGSGEAAITEVQKTAKKSIKVPETVKINGVEYAVTTINANAFKNATKATTVTLPKTVTKINANAFTKSKISKVNITIQAGAKLTVNKKAFKKSKVTNIQITMSKKDKKKKDSVIKAFTKAGIKKNKIKIKWK